MSSKFDVVILGGGPAGCVAGLQLSRNGCSVAIVDKTMPEALCIGETLPPQCSRLLADLRLFDLFKAQEPLPSRGTTSAWGSAEPMTNDFMLSPYGNGWHVDRMKFNRMLAGAAQEAGAEFFSQTAVRSCVDDHDLWRILITTKGKERLVSCRSVMDATGRAAANRFGFSRRTVFDKLIAIAGTTHAKRGSVASDYTLVEAIDTGWFYSALLPAGDYMLVYLTDSDLCSTGRAHSAAFLRSRLAGAPLTSDRIAGVPAEICIFSALTSVRETAARSNWLAIGDAARSYDPLCGLGIYSAMSSAVRGAQTVIRLIEGEVIAVRDYDDANQKDFSAYRAAHRAYYALERRWPESRFWRRRHGELPLPQLEPAVSQ